MEARPTSTSASTAIRLLTKSSAKPVGTVPATVTASEALRLWRTRLKNIEFTKAPLKGVQELIEHLEQLPPQSKVDQFAFLGKQVAVTVFFKRTGGRYLGSALLEKQDS